MCSNFYFFFCFSPLPPQNDVDRNHHVLLKRLEYGMNSQMQRTNLWPEFTMTLSWKYIKILTKHNFVHVCDDLTFSLVTYHTTSQWISCKCLYYSYHNLWYSRPPKCDIYDVTILKLASQTVRSFPFCPGLAHHHTMTSRYVPPAGSSSSRGVVQPVLSAAVTLALRSTSMKGPARDSTLLR